MTIYQRTWNLCTFPDQILRQLYFYYGMSMCVTHTYKNVIWVKYYFNCF